MYAPESRCLLFWLLLICCSPAGSQPATMQLSYNTTHISSIALTTPEGTPASLKKISSLTLFVLLSPECPLSQGYTSTLNRLDSMYQTSLNVIGLIPGKAYPAGQVKKFVADYAISYDVYIDQLMELTRYLQGSVTPEAILLSSTGEVVYRGAIDDWVSELGKKKRIVSNEYLRTAIIRYLHNQPVLIKNVKPTGCLLNEY